MTDESVGALVAFLRARFEELASEADCWGPDVDGQGGEMDVKWYKVPSLTPRIVLADAQAKLRILEQVAAAPWLPEDPSEDEPEYAYGYSRALYDVAKLLALPHADHEDYDESWRP